MAEGLSGFSVRMSTALLPANTAHGKLCVCVFSQAYSLVDREVGYCQGSAFIVGLLLMQVIFWGNDPDKILSQGVLLYLVIFYF